MTAGVAATGAGTVVSAMVVVGHGGLGVVVVVVRPGSVVVVVVGPGSVVVVVVVVGGAHGTVVVVGFGCVAVVATVVEIVVAVIGGVDVLPVVPGVIAAVVVVRPGSVVVVLLVLLVVDVVTTVVSGALVDVSVSCADTTTPGAKNAPTTNMPIGTERVAAVAMVVLRMFAGRAEADGQTLTAPTRHAGGVDVRSHGSGPGRLT